MLRIILLLLLLTFLPRQAIGSRIVFSELYVKVKGSIYRDQWIELFNFSGSNIDVSGYQIEDGLGNVSLLSSWSDAPGNSLLVFSNQITNLSVLSNENFAIVLDHDFTNSEELLSKLSPNTLILSTSESHLTGNSTIGVEDVLYLRDAEGNLLDTYGSPTVSDALPLEDQKEGESLEKIFYDEEDSEKNWSFSLSADGSTPGRSNFLSKVYSRQPASRLGINSFIITPEGIVGRSLPLTIYALDNQNRISFDFNSTFYIEYFDDLKVSDDGYIKNKKTSGKLITIKAIAGRGGRFSVSSVYAGRFAVKLSANGLSSDSTSLRFSQFPSPYRDKVVISEVMYYTESTTDLGGNERDGLDWIELYNAGNESLLLRDWTLVKNESTTYVLPQISLPDGSYFLLVADDVDFGALYSPKILEEVAGIINKVEVPFDSLTKSGGDITLKDEFSNEVDILQYTDSYLKEVKRYGKKNNTNAYITDREFISLERKNLLGVSLDGFNWGHSFYVLGDVLFEKVSSGITNSYQVPILATPGFANSRNYTTGKKLVANIVREIYVLDRASSESFFFTFSVNKSSLIEVKIYSRSGSYMGTLIEEIPGNENKEVIVSFNGILNGRYLSPGLYFVGIRAVEIEAGEESTDNMYFVIK